MGKGDTSQILKETEEIIEKCKNYSALVIGDAILDLYVFVKQKGRATKDPILSAEYVEHEDYAGGVFAVARHLESYVNKVKVVTLLGKEKSREEIFSSQVSKNTQIKSFFKKGAVTTVKKRFIDAYKGNKLFKVEYMDDKPISEELSKEIIKYLEEEIPKYDLIVVTDFGHGFLNKEIRKIIQEKSKYLAINVQSNSANMGFNYVNHYTKSDFLTLNEMELRMPLMMRFEEIGKVIEEFNEKFTIEKFIVTQGKKGSTISSKGKTHSEPVVIKEHIDTVGSGDALFAISSLFALAGASDRTITYAGNLAGGIKANYLGNKEAVTKEKLLEKMKEENKNV